MNPDQAAQLREQFPAHMIGKLPRGGALLDYCGHAAVTDRLLKVDPEWSWEPVAFNDEGLPKINIRGSQASMWIRLTVCGVTRLGVGTCETKKFEVEKELISDAIRNAAMRFGVALDLWSKEELWDAPDGVDAQTGEIRDGEVSSASPVVKASSEGRGSPSSSPGPRAATDKQKNFLRSLLEKKPLPDGCPFPVPDDISMPECSKWIEVLKELPDETPKPVRAGSMDEVKNAAAKLRDEFNAEYAAGEEPF